MQLSTNRPITHANACAGPLWCIQEFVSTKRFVTERVMLRCTHSSLIYEQTRDRALQRIHLSNARRSWSCEDR